MKDLLRRSTILASVGLALGLMVGLAFLLTGGMREALSEKSTGWVVTYLLISGGMGLINMGTVTLYDVERWSITRATATHFAICMSTLCGLGAFLGWFRAMDAAAWITLTASVAVYFLIWLVMYLSYRRKVRRMNEGLRQWKRAQTGK